MSRLPGYLALFLALNFHAAAAERTQSITLAPGWNAVWLEVEPRDANGLAQRPEVVFAGTPEVVTVARFLPARGKFEFISDPAVENLGADFWLKWRRNTLVGGNTLAGIEGNAAYLIENAAVTPVTVTLTGEVAFHRYEWVPDSYNLFGVPVGATPPTFRGFFGVAGEHPLNRIYQLVAGKWTPVGADARLRANAAYWVFSDGGSAFQGPLPVLPGAVDGALEFGADLTTAELSAANLTANPATLRLERLTDGGLALTDATSAGAIVNYDITTAGNGSGPLASRETATVRLALARPAAPGSYENLYRVSATLADGSSYFQYLPARASVGGPATGVAGDARPGLWVGDVVLTQATSMVVGKSDLAPGTVPRLEAVRRPMRYRVILHVATDGGVKLLEHATIMRKVRVSENLPEERVVVVNDAAIPGLVGIEKRGGKLVGKRFDTAGYDLPRTVAVPESADANPDYDPSLLPQTYLTSVALDGSLAPGGVVTTPTGGLVMDPWHRTNPYRHVFNPEHRKGFRITRTMRFEVGDSPAVGELQGVFEETVQGLTKPGNTHVARGKFFLRRVSEATELQ